MIPNTPGIPETINSSLRSALLQCYEFFDPAVLFAVFGHEKLVPFQENLPSANSLGGRVDLTIEYLRTKYLVIQENALTIFLCVLAKRLNTDNALRQQLETLAQEWEWFRQRPYAKPEATVLDANPQLAKMLYMIDAQKMLDTARAVAKVNIQRFVKGIKSGNLTGTGWLVTPTLALTCWHVIEALVESPYETDIQADDLQAQINNTYLTFDYLAAGQGIQYGIANLEYPTLESHPLDYALLRLTDRGDAPLLERGYVRLDTQAPLTTQTSLYIIQHPLGQPQQCAGDNYIGPSPTPHRILYKTPTEPGTSGAPVLNRTNWRAIALHNGENKEAGLREGTLLTEILTELQHNRPDLYNEILTMQKVQP